VAVKRWSNVLLGGDLKHSGYLVFVAKASTIYIAGDTDNPNVPGHLAEYKPNVMIIGINRTFRIVGPDEAVKSSAKPNPAIVIPRHYDLFRDNSLDRGIFRVFLHSAGLSEKHVLLEHGRPFSYPKPDAPAAGRSGDGTNIVGSLSEFGLVRRGANGVLRMAKAILVIASFWFSTLICLTTTVRADSAAFDLIGPKFQVHVQHKGTTVPIAEVPNLQPGDRLWVHPDLPDSQSVHYLMVVVFLRGATNPSPDSWFTRAETWTKPVHDEGIFVTVPPDAEQAIVLLAPETGGAFSTLRAAVRGKPGAFVRAAQDLQQLSLDRSRLEAYLEAVRDTSVVDPEQLKTRTIMLARSLNIKLDRQCFDKPSAQQVPCLTQNTDQMVLDDQHSQNMVATLTSGSSTDLLAQLSATPTARDGYYSAYVGAVVDALRILGSAHTAQYQYIPALALPRKDDLNLRLNNPPSFRNPKSVLVIALPPVHAAVPPPLRAIDATQVFCASKLDLVLPAEGAPLVFATELAHNFVLRVEPKSGKGFDLPAHPDAALGGFVIETQAMESKSLDGEVSGILRGLWGFHSFEGPRFRLRSSQASQWVVASKDASALITGREDTLHVKSPDACCVSEVLLENAEGTIVPVQWNSANPDELELKVPLQNASPGSVQLLVKKFGLPEADKVSLHTYAEAARLDTFTVHAGDLDGILGGTRLDEVSKLQVSGVIFTPENLSRDNQHDELKLVAHDAVTAAKLKTGDPVTAKVWLRDGRTLDLSTAVAPARPQVSILSKNVQLDSNDSPHVIQIGSQDELPQDGRLIFFLKTHVPETFPPAEQVEVATQDESFHVLLSEKDGNLTLQDAKTVFAVLDPMKLLGPSAFGPLKFRAVSADGVEGNWQPLVNLVRVPDLKAVRCRPVVAKSTERSSVPEKKSASEKNTGSKSSLVSRTAAERTAHSEKSAVAEGASASEKPTGDKDCTLSGDKLFLIDAVSADADFTSSVTVPDGFVEAALTIPEPKGKMLYLKLRDDPGTVHTAVLPILNAQP
jgi:hypothetical protein